jgi:hypothetical protein
MGSFASGCILSKNAGAKAKVARCSVVCSASGQVVHAICAEVEVEIIVGIGGGGGAEPMAGLSSRRESGCCL